MMIVQQPLVIEGSLRCELDGVPWSLGASNQRIVVDVPNVATGLKLLRLGPARRTWRRRLGEAKQFLDQTSHRLECRIGGRRVLVLGHQVGRRWWRLAGLPAMQIDFTALLSSLRRRARS